MPFAGMCDYIYQECLASPSHKLRLKLGVTGSFFTPNLDSN